MCFLVVFFLFKQKTAYEMRISDWSSDVCSSDLPNLLLCRADRPIPDDERAKISMFSNVPLDAVISVWDADSIYKIPAMLHKQGVDNIVCEALDRKSTRLNSSH